MRSNQNIKNCPNKIITRVRHIVYIVGAQIRCIDNVISAQHSRSRWLDTWMIGQLRSTPQCDEDNYGRAWVDEFTLRVSP